MIVFDEPIGQIASQGRNIMKSFLLYATFAASLLIGLSSVAVAGSTVVMVTGSGASSNQQYSSDAYNQAEQQAIGNATASCASYAAIYKGTGTVTPSANTATYRQSNGLFGATSFASGTCQIDYPDPTPQPQ